jgi:hypothetical protein
MNYPLLFDRHWQPKAAYYDIIAQANNPPDIMLRQ